MADPTLHIYLKQLRPAIEHRPQEPVRRVIPVMSHRTVLKRTSDSPVQNDDIQRWNDDGGHGRQTRELDSLEVPA
ncbi:hypothetical protein ACVWZX_004437 [Deinococcus sp. UYEF24]